MKVFLVTGEPSGDLLGSRLMAALKERGVSDFCGVGGHRMEEQGLRSLFPMSDLSLMGLAEVLPKIPLVLRRIRETVAAIRAEKPDIVVTVDSPDFCFRVAKKFIGSSIPFVHYVAPTVWAWRPGRAKKIQPLFRHLLALFPFEPPYFERVGLPCSFVGHPLVEAGIEQADAKRFRAKYAIEDNQPIIVVLPGSRRSELSVLLHDFGESLQRIKATHPDIKVVIPAVPHLVETIKSACANWAYEPLITTGDEDKYDAFKAATVALAASGTVALELGLAQTPSIIAYRIHPFTYAIYRHLIKVKYANLVNIMADEMAVPEFIQNDCTPEKISAMLAQMLDNPALREKQLQTLAKVHNWLSPSHGLSPSEKAAEVVIATAQA